MISSCVFESILISFHVLSSSFWQMPKIMFNPHIIWTKNERASTPSNKKLPFLCVKLRTICCLVVLAPQILQVVHWLLFRRGARHDVWTYKCTLCFLLHFISILLDILFVLFVRILSNTLCHGECIHVSNIILSGCCYFFTKAMLTVKKKKKGDITTYSISVIRYYGCFVFKDVSDYSEICSLLFAAKTVFLCVRWQLGNRIPITIRFSMFFNSKVKHTPSYETRCEQPCGNIRDRQQKRTNIK